MKSAHQIAQETGLQWQQISDLIKKEEFIPARKIGKFNYYDQYQEEIIHTILYHTCMTNEVTFESTINIPKTFDRFKNRTF